MSGKHMSYIAKVTFTGQENIVQAFLSYFFNSTELDSVTTVTIDRDGDEIEIRLVPVRGHERLFKRYAAVEFV